MIPLRQMFDRLVELFQPERRAPDWASFFSERQYRVFMAGVHRYFRRMGKPYYIADGVVHVEDEEVLSYGLQNVARMCLYEPERLWEVIIFAHFTGLEGALEEGAEFEVKDFDRVARLLAVRLWPLTYPGVQEDTMVIRRDLEGVASVLVLDFPMSVRSVSPEEVKQWGRPTEELFEIGLQNVRDNYTCDERTLDFGSQLQVHVLSGEHFFVATHVLMLDHHPHLLGTYGSVVAVPQRHIVLSYPIESLDVLEAFNALTQVATGMEKEGPGSIIPYVYWRKPNGTFERQPYRFEKRGDITVRLTDDFFRMLDTLPPGKVRRSKP